MRESLDTLGIKFATDKASQFSRTYAKPHDYLRHLEPFFEPLRDKPIKLAEIGIGGGESARTWLEYFPNAKIFGVDIVSNTNEWNTPGAKTHDRYTFACGDQSKPDFWSKFIEVYGGDWDVIIDDGSHISSDVIATFRCLWPHLKSRGIYEVEDLKTAWDAALWFEPSALSVLRGTSEFESIYFARELCVMRKR